MYDVMVIGGGPSGNTAAHKLASLGYQVLVLDWRQNLGDKLCTGIIGRECAQRYAPERAQVYREATSAAVVSPSGRRYRFAREQPQAYIINRVAYVASIARRAMEAGASYALNERVTSIQVSGDGVKAQATGEAGERGHEARLAVVASGFGSPLLRTLGLDSWRSEDYLVGCQAEVVARGLEETEVYLGRSVAPGSFAWLVPLDDSRALVGAITRRRASQQMDAFLSMLQASGKVQAIVKRPQQWGIPLRPLPRTYADRVLVIGDSAGLAKPTTGGGIYYSILSGEMAARAAHEAFTAGDFSARRLARYEKEWKTALGREMRIGYYARLLYESLGDEQIERLLDAFASSDVQEEVLGTRELSFDWHSGVILKALRQRRLGGLVRSFGPSIAPFLARLVRPGG